MVSPCVATLERESFFFILELHINTALEPLCCIYNTASNMDTRKITMTWKTMLMTKLLLRIATMHVSEMGKLSMDATKITSCITATTMKMMLNLRSRCRSIYENYCVDDTRMFQGPRSKRKSMEMFMMSFHDNPKVEIDVHLREIRFISIFYQNNTSWAREKSLCPICSYWGSAAMLLPWAATWERESLVYFANSCI